MYSSKQLLNNSNIKQNKLKIHELETDINNVKLGLVVEDEYGYIRYSGYTDWRVKIEIYSNVDIFDSNIMNINLLNNNNYDLICTDYVHLENIAELSNLDVCIIDTYTKYTDNLEKKEEDDFNKILNDQLPKGRKILFENTITFENVIFQNLNERLLLHVNVNILLQNETTISFKNISDSELPSHSVYINNKRDTIYIYKPGVENNNISYQNLKKGWNTIDWYFIHDLELYKENQNIKFYLGFNPKDLKPLLISDLNLNSSDIVTLNHQSFKYIIDDENDNSKYIIEQNKESIEDPTFISKNIIYTSDILISNSINLVYDFSDDFTKIKNKTDTEFCIKIYIDNIKITNYSSNLSIDDLKITYGETKVSNLNDNQYIKTGDFHIYNLTDELLVDDYIINSDSDIVNSELNIIFNENDSKIYNYRIDITFIIENCDTTPAHSLIIQNSFANKMNFDNKIFFQKDGSVGIGTDNTHGYSLYVNNISNNKKGIYCADDITILSDAKYKTNIKTITNPIEKLLKLRGVTYNRIDRNIDETRYGFIAQEVQQIIPEACDGDNGIKYTDIVALLVEGFKELYNK